MLENIHLLELFQWNVADASSLRHILCELARSLEEIKDALYESHKQLKRIGSAQNNSLATELFETSVSLTALIIRLNVFQEQVNYISPNGYNIINSIIEEFIKELKDNTNKFDLNHEQMFKINTIFTNCTKRFSMLGNWL